MHQEVDPKTFGSPKALDTMPLQLVLEDFIKWRLPSIEDIIVMQREKGMEVEQSEETSF